ncbi:MULTISPECIES: BsaWI family type II restriction enzyme [unclassified Desulfovibrio]|uniref:BsaWI family type II restriction enzyme n=1 Tax=unclassified Desulfovibrio TaxID=2593640 RepID=UPI0013EBBEBF|nr:MULTISPECIES: BsaWI family type II restriction enzyme [unclassified Desulfovibrio]
MPVDLKKFCSQLYLRYSTRELARIVGARHLSQQQMEKAAIEARKKAIEQSFAEAVTEYPDVEPHQLWDAIYVSHVKLKSGVDNLDVIGKIVSSHQSWIKSSGHAYEEIIKSKATEALSPHKIKIVLQRDLTEMLRTGSLTNASRDIEIFERMKRGTFDLYAIVSPEKDKNYCFGCIQCKTSIRERVKGDREPSIQAMNDFFWSTIFVLNGDFLRLPEFIEMVNGGTEKFSGNGWHGMYVFSHLPQNDRIYPTNLAFTNFQEHAVQAANMWLTQRQWLNTNWRAD